VMGRVARVALRPGIDHHRWPRRFNVRLPHRQARRAVVDGGIVSVREGEKS
jgi:hypothetical protein